MLSNFPPLYMQQKTLSHFITPTTSAAKRGLMKESFSRAINLNKLILREKSYDLPNANYEKSARTDLNCKKGYFVKEKVGYIY